MNFLVALDLLLLLGFTLRLNRLLIIDDMGQWFFQEPVKKWLFDDPKAVVIPPYENWKEKLASGLNCPFCLGFWVGALMSLLLWAVGGPGSDSLALEVWRWIAGVFTVNYVVAHVGSRLGDAGYAEQTIEISEGE